MMRLLRIGSILLGLVFSCQLFAQRLTDRDAWRGVYRHYDCSSPRVDTPAPKGYKPFYISHYGRHGSRYPVDRNYLWNVVKTLQPLADEGLLTPAGLKLIDDCRVLDSICTPGPYGELSALGALEHRTIAANMARRWSTVFTRPGRHRVDVYCSYVPRCIHSMENFTSSLSEYYPELEYSIDTSRATYGWLVNNRNTKPATAAARKEVEAEWGRDFDWTPFYERLFTDPSAALAKLRSRYLLCEFIYTNGSMVPLYAQDSGVDLTSVFTDEEFAEICDAYNDKTWGGHGNSVSNGDWRIHNMDSLMVHYVADADAVVEAFTHHRTRQAPVATLRFGHDTSLLPFLCLMGIDGCHEQLPTVGASRVFNSSEDLTMAANIITVFYRNRRGDVLVKFVHSGRETSIPALTPVSGPYYRWSDVRSFFLSRLAR